MVGRQARRSSAIVEKLRAEPRLSACHDLAEVADRALRDVGEGQERDEAILGADRDDFGDPGDRRAQIAVGEDRSLGRAGGTTRVHNRGDRLRSNRLRSAPNDLGFCRELVAPEAAEILEREHKVVVETVGYGTEHDDVFERGQPVTTQQHLGELIPVADEAHFGA